MAKTINLSKDFSMPAVDYAGQGNAILGIRDAGKTYTAMKAAEELLEAKIPIIVYDPVGVWKNLKVGTGSHKGFPIVVAGGEGADIRLNETNAVAIVRAAMKENVSLVIDLYSPELINKSKWIRIVQETVDLLMYENKECGLRHIFIEEAAEFIPQRLQPQHSKVYSSLERLARMGRNARLGYTLINQRAEEINKAILEISALSLLHKQVGKNSLKSIQTWLELLQVENAKQVIQSLPGLKQGECWVIGMHTKPHQIKVADRKTFHPDPKKNVTDIGVGDKMKVDVSSFVEKLSQQLQKEDFKKVSKTTRSGDRSLSPAETNQLSELQKKYDELKDQYEDLLSHYKEANRERLEYLEAVKFYSKQHLDLKTILDREFKMPAVPVHNFTSKVVHNSAAKIVDSARAKNAHTANGEKLGKCPMAILTFLASFPGRTFTKAQVGIATGYSPGSGGFNNALSELNTKGAIVRDGGKIMISGREIIDQYFGTDFRSQEYSIYTFKDKLGKCEREIYEVLLEQPDRWFTKPDLASYTPSNYSPNSGGFNNALSTLNTLELIERKSGEVRLNPELLEI